MVDYTTIIVGLLAFAGTIVGSYFANNKTIALITYRIDQLEEKVNKHNQVVERTALLERDVKTCFKLYDDMKEEVNK